MPNGLVRAATNVARIVPPRLLLYAGLLYVIFAWALNTVLVKQAVTQIDPLAFTFMRFIAMTPLAFLLVRISGSRIHVARSDIALLVLCGACGYGVYQYLWIIGLSHTTAFASALLGAMSPIFTLAIVAGIGQERVRGGRWVGSVVALIGITIFEGAFSGAATFRIGDLLTLGAALVFAAYNVVSARLLDRYTPLELLAITMAIGTVMIAPGGVPALLHTNFAHLGWDVWWRLMYATTFPILLTYPVWSYAITRIGAGRVSMFGFLVPVMAGLLSIPILHAHFTIYELVGAAVCLAGMLISNAFARISLTALWAQRTLPFER
ncbi:MAG: DMT family transporter [Candidatus Eremiobacteraeota bacterium]|nr:DMT family transporter [Candidatus Eremiobacteraeota bacterium]